ncbi:MAG: hypothetical protein ACYCUI_09595, partial [Vulcanimicrobiaceae bacterium]
MFLQQLANFFSYARDAANRQGVNVVPTAYAVYNGVALPSLTISGATAALDTTQHQFGLASLKLTATAATVSVELPSGTIPISAFQRWIASVYMRTSRTAVAGTLAVVTATGTYSATITSSTAASVWYRLWGDMSLVGDDATACTVQLTFTGCTVGDTFNLEGWQLEAASGATNLPSPFANSAAPGSADFLPDGGAYVRLASSHASGNVAYNYKGVWSSAASYVIGDEVVYGSSYWIAIAASLNSAPQTGNANWQVVGSYSGFLGAWSATTTYAQGAEVTYAGNYWVCVTGNTNSAPTTSNANWQIAGPATLDNIPDGTTYARTLGSGLLSGHAAYTADSGGTIHLIKGVGDASTLGLDGEIADGTTYLRMPGANMDSNRRGLIDFSQVGHLNKTIDYVGDGTTYARVRSGQLQSGVVFNIQSGRNFIFNPTFMQNIGGAGNGQGISSGIIVDGWTAGGGGPYTYAIGYNGTLRIRTTAGQVIPNGIAYQGYAVSNSFSVYAGAPYTFNAVRSWYSVSPPPAGAVVYHGLYLSFMDYTGATIRHDVFDASIVSGQTNLVATGTVPAGAVTCVAYLYMFSNNSGAAYTIGSGNYYDAVISDIEFMQASNLDTEVIDGTTYARILGSQLTSGAHKLTVAGSGMQVADQRNLLPILSAGAQAVWQNLSITYTAAAGSPATATISVSAAQILGLQNAGATVGYNASSANVTGTGGTVPTYFLYYIDPGYSGGTQTLYATTTGNDLRQQLGIVYIGSVAVTFPTSGSGGGSGGGGLCVTERMFIRRGRRAVDAIAGEIFDCADFP